MILLKLKSNSVISLLEILQWLPFSLIVNIKVFMMNYKALMI